MQIFHGACLQKIRTLFRPARSVLFSLPEALPFAFERTEVIGLLLPSAIHASFERLVPIQHAAGGTHFQWLESLALWLPSDFRVAFVVGLSGRLPVRQFFDRIELVTQDRLKQLLRQPCGDSEEFQPWLLADSPAGLLLAF